MITCKKILRFIHKKDLFQEVMEYLFKKYKYNVYKKNPSNYFCLVGCYSSLAENILKNHRYNNVIIA